MSDFSADIQYLMQEPVGKVIAEGLAILYKQQPTHPIDFLAKWFLNYAATQKNRQNVEVEEKLKNELIEKFKLRAEKTHNEQENKKKEQASAAKVEENYHKEIIGHEYHHELLPQSLANFIEKQKGFSGVYIGNYDHPTRPITADDDEEQAHLDTAASRQINYIGASDSHKMMLGKNLPPPDSEVAQTKTVTYEVFKEREDPEAQQQENQNGEEEEGGEPQVKVEKPIYLYVPDVTKEDRMYYFKIPKLGAYLACPLIYNSCLTTEAFDAGVEGRRQFLEAKQDLEVRKKEEKEKLDERLADLEEETEEYQQAVDEYTAVIQGMEDPVEAPFQTQKREYVVCIDTLGQDQEISEEDRKYVEDLIKLFANSWEEKERKLLSKDIDEYLKLNDAANYREVVDEYTEKMEEEANNREVPAEADETEGEYIRQTARVEFLKDLLLSDENKNKIKSLAHLRVLKFPGLIQNALYLVGYDKQAIDLPDTNILNWKVVKSLLNDEDFFEKLRNYDWVGAKGSVERYAFINRILRRMDRFVAEDVDSYNVGLGLLLKFLKGVADLRIRDIKRRRTEKARLTEVRNKAIEDKAEWERQRQEALEEAQKAAEETALAKQAEEQAQQKEDDGEEGDDEDKPAAGEDEEKKLEIDFNEEEFLAEWEASNPPIEVPEEVVEEQDLDLEEEEDSA